jgi:hypothetical protein
MPDPPANLYETRIRTMMAVSPPLGETLTYGRAPRQRTDPSWGIPPGGRVSAGGGMLTSVKTFKWRGELYEAGTTRVAPIADVARHGPVHLLRPAWGQDPDPEIRAFVERTGIGKFEPVRSTSAPPAAVAASSAGTPRTTRTTPLNGESGTPGYRPPEPAPPPIVAGAVMLACPEFEAQVHQAAAERHRKNADSQAASKRPRLDGGWH